MDFPHDVDQPYETHSSVILIERRVESFSDDLNTQQDIISGKVTFTTKKSVFYDAHLNSVVPKPSLFEGGSNLVNTVNISKTVFAKPTLNSIKRWQFLWNHLCFTLFKDSLKTIFEFGHYSKVVPLLSLASLLSPLPNVFSHALSSSEFAMVIISQFQRRGAETHSLFTTVTPILFILVFVRWYFWLVKPYHFSGESLQVPLRT